MVDFADLRRSSVLASNLWFLLGVHHRPMIILIEEHSADLVNGGPHLEF